MTFCPSLAPWLSSGATPHTPHLLPAPRLYAALQLHVDCSPISSTVFLRPIPAACLNLHRSSTFRSLLAPQLSSVRTTLLSPAPQLYAAPQPHVDFLPLGSPSFLQSTPIACPSDLHQTSTFCPLLAPWFSSVPTPRACCPLLGSTQLLGYTLITYFGLSSIPMLHARCPTFGFTLLTNLSSIARPSALQSYYAPGPTPVARPSALHCSSVIF